MKVLNIIHTAYRATLEEQDDTIVWMTHALKGAGCPVDVLLCDSAVSYAVKAQDASGLVLGGISQTHPPDLAGDIRSLIDKGATVYIVKDDLKDRGINFEEGGDLIDGLTMVRRNGVCDLYIDYDHVWRW